jgi:hypothetical protein
MLYYLWSACSKFIENHPYASIISREEAILSSPFSKGQLGATTQNPHT